MLIAWHTSHLFCVCVCVHLSQVPLKVAISSGKSWGSMSELHVPPLSPSAPLWNPILFSLSFLSFHLSLSFPVCLSASLLTCPASTSLWKPGSCSSFQLPVHSIRILGQRQELQTGLHQFSASLTLSLFILKKEIPRPAPLLFSHYLVKTSVFSLPHCQGEATHLRERSIYIGS